MKILVIGNPECCGECPLCFYNKGIFICNRTTKKVDKNKMDEDCPLKPMPEKLDNPYDEEQDGYLWDESYAVGYNDCLDDILGEEELIEYFDKRDDEENKIPNGFWYEDTDKRKPSEETIYRKPNGEEYMWKDDVWERIK